MFVSSLTVTYHAHMYPALEVLGSIHLSFNIACVIKKYVCAEALKSGPIGIWSNDPSADPKSFGPSAIQGWFNSTHFPVPNSKVDMQAVQLAGILHIEVFFLGDERLRICI